MRLFGPALVGTLLACTSVHAQDSQAAPSDPARFNTEIVVTPERGETPRALVPAASVVLDDTSLIALPTAHPSEILRFLPGFNVARPDFYAGRPVVSARGFFGGGEAEYIRLLVDGVPVADVESGLIDWAIVPASAIRRVEAVRGPGASLYGDSAIGGVVQILTDRTTRGGQATVTGGSFSTLSVDGSYSARSRGIGVQRFGRGPPNRRWLRALGRSRARGRRRRGRRLPRVLVALECIGHRARSRRPWSAERGGPRARSLFVGSALSFRQRRPSRLLDGVYPSQQHADLETAGPLCTSRHATRTSSARFSSPLLTSATVVRGRCRARRSAAAPKANTRSPQRAQWCCASAWISPVSISTRRIEASAQPGTWASSTARRPAIESVRALLRRRHGTCRRACACRGRSAGTKCTTTSSARRRRQARRSSAPGRLASEQSRD